MYENSLPEKDQTNSEPFICVEQCCGSGFDSGLIIKNSQNHTKTFFFTVNTSKIVIMKFFTFELIFLTFMSNQKKSYEKLVFFLFRSDPKQDPFFHETDPRIQIRSRIKMKRTRNTVFNARIWIRNFLSLSGSICLFPFLSISSLLGTFCLCIK